MTEFGEYIQWVRSRKGLSLSEAAAEIGCTKAHLHDLEKARSRNPGIALLNGIARTYALNLGHLAEVAARSLPAKLSAGVSLLGDKASPATDETNPTLRERGE